MIDGDTIRVRWKDGETFVRIRGIDAPESGGSDKSEADLDRTSMSAPELWALGGDAAQWLRTLLRGRSLYLHVQPTPVGPKPYLHHRQYRLLAYVSLDAADGPDVGEAMIRAGYALVWPRNVPTRRYLHPRSGAYVATCNASLGAEPGLWPRGLRRLCPRHDDAGRPWSLDDCNDHCHRSDWRAPEEIA